jgi:methionyl-tRNA synthetase
MGKDNIPFHTVIFPSSLLGTGDNYTLLHHVSTTEYLNYEGGKFSKSRNLGVFGNHAKETGIPSEVWRYYLLVNRPEHSDSSFSWDDFLEKNNNELLANIGNLTNRALTFVKSSFGGKVPALGELKPEDQQFIDAVNKEVKEYLAALDKVHIKDGLRIAMGIGKLANKFVQGMKFEFVIL